MNNLSDHILVADDDSETRHLLQQYLEKNGYRLARAMVLVVGGAGVIINWWGKSALAKTATASAQATPLKSRESNDGHINANIGSQ